MGRISESKKRNEERNNNAGVIIEYKGIRLMVPAGSTIEIVDDNIRIQTEDGITKTKYGITDGATTNGIIKEEIKKKRGRRKKNLENGRDNLEEIIDEEIINDIINKIPPWMVMGIQEYKNFIRKLALDDTVSGRKQIVLSTTSKKLKEEGLYKELFKCGRYNSKGIILRELFDWLGKKEESITKKLMINIFDLDLSKKTGYPIIKQENEPYFSYYLFIPNFICFSNGPSIFYELIDYRKSNKIIKEYKELKLGRIKEFKYEEHNMKVFVEKTKKVLGELGLKVNSFIIDAKSALWFNLSGKRITLKELEKEKYLHLGIVLPRVMEYLDNTKIENGRLIINLDKEINPIETLILSSILREKGYKEDSLTTYISYLRKLISAQKEGLYDEARRIFERVKGTIKGLEERGRVKFVGDNKIIINDYIKNKKGRNKKKGNKSKNKAKTGIDRVIENSVIKNPFDKYLNKFSSEVILNYLELKRLFPAVKGNREYSSDNIDGVIRKILDNDITNKISMEALMRRIEEGDKIPVWFDMYLKNNSFYKFYKSITSNGTKDYKNAFLSFGFVAKALLGFDPRDKRNEIVNRGRKERNHEEYYKKLLIEDLNRTRLYHSTLKNAYSIFRRGTINDPSLFNQGLNKKLLTALNPEFIENIKSMITGGNEGTMDIKLLDIIASIPYYGSMMSLFTLIDNTDGGMTTELSNVTNKIYKLLKEYEDLSIEKIRNNITEITKGSLEIYKRTRNINMPISIDMFSQVSNYLERFLSNRRGSKNKEEYVKQNLVLSAFLITKIFLSNNIGDKEQNNNTKGIEPYETINREFYKFFGYKPFVIEVSPDEVAPDLEGEIVSIKNNEI